jgi:exodeoxyribonuclease VII large subunit
MAVPVREELRLGLSQLSLRLQGGIIRAWQQRKDRLDGLARGLPKPVTLLEHAAQRLDDWSERLHQAMRRRVKTGEDRLERFAQLLEALNYKRVLERGYALVTADNGKLVSSAEAAKKEAALRITFHDGEVPVTRG